MKNIEAKISGAENDVELSRRAFLKTTATGVLGLLLSGRTREAAAIVESLSEENPKEKGPRFSVNFYFAPHGTVEDLKKLPEFLKKSDVFVPEAPGWTESYARNLSLIASGELDPEDFFKDKIISKAGGRYEAFEIGLIRSLYNTKVRIEFFDLPAHEPLNDEIRDSLIDILNIDEKKGLTILVRDLKEKMKRFAELQLRREEYNLSRFLEFKRAIKEGRIPGVGGKENVTILFSMGTSHTGLYHKIYREKNRDEIKGFYPVNPTVRNHFVEMMRRFLFKKGEVSDDLALRVLVELVSTQAFFKMLPSPDTTLKNTYMRKAIASFTKKELEDLFEQITNGWPVRSIVISYLQEALKKKNIKLPASEHELEDIMSSSRLRATL